MAAAYGSGVRVWLTVPRCGLCARVEWLLVAAVQFQSADVFLLRKNFKSVDENS